MKVRDSGMPEEERFDLRPYHYGLLFRKPASDGRRA